MILNFLSLGRATRGRNMEFFNSYRQKRRCIWSRRSIWIRIWSKMGSGILGGQWTQAVSWPPQYIFKTYCLQLRPVMWTVLETNYRNIFFNWNVIRGTGVCNLLSSPAHSKVVYLLESCNHNEIWFLQGPCNSIMHVRLFSSCSDTCCEWYYLLYLVTDSNCLSLFNRNCSLLLL